MSLTQASDRFAFLSASICSTLQSSSLRPASASSVSRTSPILLSARWMDRRAKVSKSLSPCRTITLSTQKLNAISGAPAMRMPTAIAISFREFDSTEETPHATIRQIAVFA